MSTANNDNYRPGLSMPSPVKTNGGWLSGNLAQLMVFLNGLILTVTAFATLTVFIDEIVTESTDRKLTDVREYIESGYADFEKGIGFLSMVTDIGLSNPQSDLKNYIRRGAEDLAIFDQVFYLEKNTAGQDQMVPLLQNSDTGYYQMQSGDLIALAGKHYANQESHKILLITDSGNDRSSEENRDFFLLTRFLRTDGSVSYLAGLSNFSKFIKEDWLEKYSDIALLEIFDPQDDAILFRFARQQLQPVERADAKNYLSIFPADFSGRIFDIRLELKLNPREAFLQKIPLLMLLFGVTLTLIGTLYVRNNQTQSKKLAQMNRELAHKNFELSQEIGERERLNKIIHKSAKDHQKLINSVNDIIFECAIDGVLIFLNKAWEKVTGYDPKESTGQSIFDLLHVQDQEEQRANFMKLAEGKTEFYRVFTRLRTQTGQYRAVELSVSLISQDQGKDTRLVGTITDVEERRRAERALSEAEKKYRMIVENAAGGIYQMTEDEKIISANPSFARIFGFSTADESLRFINAQSQTMYHDKILRERFLSDVKSARGALVFEGQIVRKDGSLIWVRENVRAVKDDEGNILFFEGSMEDIDQRKKAELALQSAKTESDLASRAKSEFLKNMSHELRTPLNAIIGFSEMIKNEVFGSLPVKEYKDYAADIYSSGKTLLTVINEILDVSKIEAGERTLQEGVVHVKDIFDSCLSLMETKIKASRIRVENKTKDSPLTLIGEKQAVKQMLMNLMSNAVKYSPDNSFMLLDAELDSKGRLRLSVTDTGVGLTEEELEKALSPFGQIEADHSRSKSGTGLGLTLVKSLIELHGGELEMVSQKGIGTTATLIFPAKRVGNKTLKSKRPVDEKVIPPQVMEISSDIKTET